MKRTYNERHDVIINSYITDLKETGKIYRDGDPIMQSNRVDNVRVLHYHGDVIVPVFLSR